MNYVLVLSRPHHQPRVEGPGTKDACVKRAVGYLAAMGVKPCRELDAALGNHNTIPYGNNEVMQVVKLIPLPE